MDENGQDKLNNQPERADAADDMRAEDIPAADAENAEPAPVETVTAQPVEVAESADVGKPKRKKASNIFWNVFLVVVIAIGILSLFGIVREIDPEQGASLGEVLKGASPLFFAVLVLVVVALMALDVSKYCIISKTVTGKLSLGTSAKCHFIGKYYDAVTPFSTGGQPMQIYYLNSKGISGGNASAMVLIRYFSSVLCWVTLGGILMIVGAAQNVLEGVSGGTLLKVTGWVGIAINMLIPVFVTLFLIFPKIMYKLTNGVVRLGYKFKIVKDVEKATARATKVVDDFKSSFKVMATSPVKLILLFVVSFAESALTFAIPFFVMKAFGCSVDDMLISVMALNSFATFGVSFIPTPGNSGVVESMGALAFSAAAGVALVWSVLLWRMLVFYLYIFIGLGITVFDIVNKNIQYKKNVGNG